MKIVAYKFKTEPWQMVRYDPKKMFFTASQKPTKFRDGRGAAPFAKRCAAYAKRELGWTDVPFKTFDEFEFRELQHSEP